MKILLNNIINFYNRSILKFKKISFYYFKNEKQTWYFRIKNKIKINKCQVVWNKHCLNNSSVRLCVPGRFVLCKPFKCLLLCNVWWFTNFISFVLVTLILSATLLYETYRETSSLKWKHNFKIIMDFVEDCHWVFLSFVRFLIGHCIVCPSIYHHWLPLWHIQTFHIWA